MLRELELYYLDLIKGKKKGFFPNLLRGILWLFSGLFWLVVRLRNWAYDAGWFHCYYPPVPLVISVGNIVAGGAGKTPVTLLIAEALYNDFNVGIIARGYRSQAECCAKSMVLSKGQGPLHPASFCGDEPYLISQHLPRAIVIVGKSRQQSANQAAKLGAQVIVMDDAMQHRRIARDLEVVVIDSREPFGLGYYLPRGLLREGIQSLARADLIILNHAQNVQEAHRLLYQMMRYTSAPAVLTCMEVEEIFDMEDKVVPSIEGQNLGIFCGIAHPDYFHETILQLKGNVVAELILADHEALNHEQLLEYAQSCKEKGATALICTEKDKVKLGLRLDLPLPIYWTRMRLKIVEGQPAWDAFIQKAKTALKHF